MRYKLILSILSIVFCVNTNEYSPLNVYSYKLDNGLTVILNEDHNTTSVFGAIAVKGGGKRDPKDATGIAHYLEHLLFKGTQDMGTINYEKEKIFLDSIEIKYDELSIVSDSQQRLAIQKEINRLSVKAAEFAIPNEFDRIMEEMGGSWINAFTSNDAIVYLNKFPGNQYEKWLEVYSHRFIDPVFRLFQAELETVYEEKNRSMDNFYRQVFQTFSENFFKNHPYGQQTILGSVEHLKNPSISKMKDYFDTYYVPNNMALILTGDIYIDDIKPIIEEKFGIWESAEMPGELNISENPFNGREYINKDITPIKMGMLGYRTVPAGNDDQIILDVCISLLTNDSGNGLIDLLRVENKLQGAGAYNMSFVDHGGANFYFFPSPDQTIEDAESIVLSQIQKLKSKDFTDDFFEAVKLTMARNYEENIENMESRLFTLIDVYINNQEWSDVIDWPERLNKISKDDIARISNKYFGDNYLVFHSNEGNIEKQILSKPPFDPIIPKNSEAKSDFSKRISEIPSRESKLRFIEFKRGNSKSNDVNFSNIQNKTALYHTHNPINGIFTLAMSYGVGNLEIPELDQTAEYLNLLGTDNYSFNEFKNELQKIGTSMSFSVDKNYFYINLKGFDKNFAKSIQLVNEFVLNVKLDENKIKILIDSAESSRKIENEQPSTIGRALRDFIALGNKSYYLRRMSVDEIQETQPYEYIDFFNKAMDYELDILYTGKLSFNTVSNILKNNMELNPRPTRSNSPLDMQMKRYVDDLVYIVNDDQAVQSQIYFSVSGENVNSKDRVISKAYNKYFGTGMSSIVFQEIREFRSLAYSAWGFYVRPNRNGKRGDFVGYVGCQADKTIDAISVFKDITFNMPEKPERIDQIKSSLIQTINSERPNFREYPSIVRDWKKMSYFEDPRKKQVNYFERMFFSDIVKFQKKNIVGKPMVITIYTDVDQVDMAKLSKFGEVIILEKSDFIN